MDLNKEILECPLIFLDLETTGLSPERSYICEVAAFRIEKGEILGKFCKLVRPHHKVPYEAFCIHQISDKDLIGAPYFESIAVELSSFLSAGILCAYNVAFDLGFINYQLKKVNLNPLNLPFVDILTMARSSLKLKSYKLEEVSRFFGLTPNEQFHRAESDAYITYLVFRKLIEVIKGKHSFQAKEFIKLYGRGVEGRGATS